jgi:hypothetical protein
MADVESALDWSIRERDGNEDPKTIRAQAVIDLPNRSGEGTCEQFSLLFGTICHRRGTQWTLLASHKNERGPVVSTINVT